MEMRILPRGKNIVAAGYDPVTGTLRSRFNKSGEYEYANVPEEKFVSLCRVPFPDSYFTKSIKGKFKSTKIEVEDGRGQSSRPANEQDAAGRDSNSRTIFNPSLDAKSDPRVPGSGQTELSDGGRISESTGGRIVETYFPNDGMKFHSQDANGNPAHFYTLKDERIPFSLTQVLELSGLARQPQSAQEAEAWAEKANLGTKVHEYTLWLDQDEISLDDLKAYSNYYNRVLGWKQFEDDFKFQPDLTMCEVPVGVRVNGMLYATKVDAYGVIGDVDNLAMAVVEKKCSVNIEKHYALQTAGEAMAFKQQAEAVNMPLKRYLVQLLDQPNGSGRCYKAVEHTDRNDEKVFVGAGLMNVYTRLNYGTLEV